VARDASGNFAAGTITANLTGTATTATNSTNATITTSATASAFKVPFANTTASTTGNYSLLQDSEATFTYNPSTNTLVAGTFSGSGASITAINASNISTGTLANARTTATSANGANTIVSRDASGNFSANIITGTNSVTAPAVAVSNGIFVNTIAIAANYTIPTNYNAGSFGPVTVNSGITVTVPSGSVWTIV
jgi:hypothetical protein